MTQAQTCPMSKQLSDCEGRMMGPWALALLPPGGPETLPDQACCDVAKPVQAHAGCGGFPDPGAQLCTVTEVATPAEPNVSPPQPLRESCRPVLGMPSQGLPAKSCPSGTPHHHCHLPGGTLGHDALAPGLSGLTPPASRASV